MRILILSCFLPHPDAGHAGGAVLWRMIQGLSSRHELHLISFVGSDKEQRQSRELLDQCVSVQTVWQANASTASAVGMRAGERLHNLLFSRLPYEVWRFRSQAMTRAIARALDEIPFDIVQVEFTQMGLYADALRGHPRLILREYDLAYLMRWRRLQTTRGLGAKLYQYVQWRRMRRFEWSIYRRFHRIVVPSEPIKAELLARWPDLSVSVVPFGMTLPDAPAWSDSSEAKHILFVGAMGRSLNVEGVMYFYQQIWPQIRLAEPEAEFWIVGNDPPPRVRQLAQMDARVKVAGFVDDLGPFYARASVFVAPLLVGGGVVTKMLDAMASSKAVVATSIANEGIGAVPGRDLLVADEPEAFARCVIEMLRDPAQRRQLGQNGCCFVEAHYSWPGIIGRLEGVYAALVDPSAE